MWPKTRVGGAFETRGGGPEVIKVEREIVVDRPPEEVFAYLSDPDNIPEWQSGVLEARKDSQGPMGVGARWREVRTFLGRRIEQTIEATAFEAGKEFSLEVVSGPVPFRIRHLFEAAGGGTRIRVTGEGELGGFAKLGRRFVIRALERQFETDFAKLKEVVESRPR
jgi:carbon monoxide dehydrogenase subunit G